jgi:uncharacterized membrane protein YfcA
VVERGGNAVLLPRGTCVNWIVRCLRDGVPRVRLLGYPSAPRLSVSRPCSLPARRGSRAQASHCAFRAADGRALMSDGSEIAAVPGRSPAAAFGSGAIIGMLGGLIGLGGAEFRLPLLISLFRFRGLEAVILNKATSLIVVATALPFRAATVPFSEIRAHWPIIMNLLAGSLLGPYAGAEWATRLKTQALYRIIAALLVIIAGVLLFAHDTTTAAPAFTGWLQIAAGIVAGLVIGVIASLLGVAGGEFLIPTLVLLFGADIKLAGSLSLAVSLPTMLVGFARYSRDQSFQVLAQNWTFLLVMAVGSMVGTFIGGRLLGIVPIYVLLPLLACILVISAVKVWGHK